VAFVDRKIDLVEGTHGGLALAVELRNLLEFEQAHRDRPSFAACAATQCSRTLDTILSILQSIANVKGPFLQSHPSEATDYRLGPDRLLSSSSDSGLGGGTV
jgi:hypothetical protein